MRSASLSPASILTSRICDQIRASRSCLAARTTRCLNLTMSLLNQLLENNRAWSAEMTRQDADFFKRLAAQQTPHYLWIGCADSRVPANQIVNSLPGDMFVHRNVANVVVHTDLNCLSTIQFAVDVLRVPDIIVCGHYGCGGVLAALQNQKLGLIDNWLRHVQDVLAKHRTEINSLTT